MDFIDVLKFMGVFILVVLLVFGMVGVINNELFKVSCEHFAQLNSQYDFQYSFWTGCIINWQGTWVSTDHIQVVSGDIQIEK